MVRKSRNVPIVQGNRVFNIEMCWFEYDPETVNALHDEMNEMYDAFEDIYSFKAGNPTHDVMPPWFGSERELAEKLWDALNRMSFLGLKISCPFTEWHLCEMMRLYRSPWADCMRDTASIQKQIPLLPLNGGIIMELPGFSAEETE